MRRPSIFEVATAFEDGQEGVMKQQDEQLYRIPFRQPSNYQRLE